MLRTTVIFAATAAMLLAGCGKSSPTSSYNELAHVTATPSPTTYNGQPIATGVDASTVVTQTGSVSLGLNALKDPSNTIASLTVSLAATVRLLGRSSIEAWSVTICRRPVTLASPSSSSIGTITNLGSP